jgi:hypothetical protein
MENLTFEALVSAITDATRKTLLELFEEDSGRFYYFALIDNSGVVSSPIVSAWSYEALEEEEDDTLKWEWAESPYYMYGEEHFEEVRKMLGTLPHMPDLNDDTLWEKEFQFRAGAMVAALKQLDGEGLFSKNQPRHEIFVNVEMTDGYENIKRALELNPKETVDEYQKEGEGFYADDGRR